MNIKISRQNQAVHFRAMNSDGNTIDIDGSSQVGGVGKGMRPMEVMLSSIATCSAIDLVEILKKQRQPLVDLTMDVKGTRREDATPKPFTEIHITYKLSGDLDLAKAERAAELALEKYCSASASLDPSITLTHSVEIIPA